MSTRIATSIAQGSSADVGVALERAVRAGLGDRAPALLLVFATAFPGAALLGASTAGEFTEARDAKSSATVFALAGDFRVFTGMSDGLGKDPEAAIKRAIEGLPGELLGYPHRTAILLLDPLAGNGEEATLITASLLGGSVRLAGGAAGDDLLMKAPVVSCGARAAGDSVAIALVFSKSPLGVGVCHGHRPLSTPMRVTRAAGNVVQEIDGRPAWPVWLEATRADAASRGVDVNALPKEDEGAYLLRYEAGLAAGDDYKIRAPLSRDENGAIHFACGMPEGTVFRITESVPERQIDSAREAARRARKQLGDQPVAGAVVFDCICRNLILGRDFGRAVTGISEELGKVPLAGFETYGEIALDVGDLSGFHNTTSVVLAFPA
jgi:methyl-accepting chemotaxis protein